MFLNFTIIATLLYLSPFLASSENLMNCHEPHINLEKINNYLNQFRQPSYYLKEFPDKEHQLNDLTQSLHAALYSKCLAGRISKNYVGTLDSDSLHNLYIILYDIAFYTRDKKVIDLIESVILEKKFRLENVNNFKVNLYKLYTASRQFDKAKALKKAHPKLNFPYIPKIMNEGSIFSNQIINISQDSLKMSFKTFDFPDGKHIVVIGHPLCHFSQNFNTWLKKHKSIKTIFDLKSTWLVPTSGLIYAAEIADYNVQNENPYYIVYENEQWSDITYWGTPTFYFYDGTKLLGQLVGWPEESQAKLLLNKLEEFSFLTEK